MFAPPEPVHPEPGNVVFVSPGKGFSPSRTPPLPGLPLGGFAPGVNVYGGPCGISEVPGLGVAPGSCITVTGGSVLVGTEPEPPSLPLPEPPEPVGVGAGNWTGAGIGVVGVGAGVVGVGEGGGGSSIGVSESGLPHTEMAVHHPFLQTDFTLGFVSPLHSLAYWVSVFASGVVMHSAPSSSGVTFGYSTLVCPE